MDPWAPLQTDEEIAAQLKNSRLGTTPTPPGHARWAPSQSPGSVVDARGKVHGLENLYVADASIIPVIPLANTNLTSMLIGMKVGLGVAG